VALQADPYGHHRLEKGDTLDDFVVVDVIGRSSQAVLYRLVHSNTGEERALKLLHTIDPEIRMRLESEATAQSRLRHENVVRVFGMAQVGQRVGLYMEYVRGPTLAEWLAKANPRLETRLTVFRGVLAAVHDAHANGLIHRDVQPENVLMGNDGDRWLPKLTDFGLVLDKNTGRRITRPGTRLGSLWYMSPEQMHDSRRVDHRSDLFSLGSLLYQLVTGYVPFTGADQVSLMTAVAEANYPAPLSIVPDLPEAVVDTINRLLVVDVDERLQSCEEIEMMLYGDVSLLGEPHALEREEVDWTEEVQPIPDAPDQAPEPEAKPASDMLPAIVVSCVGLLLGGAAYLIWTTL